MYSTSLRSILLYTCLNNVKGTFTEFLNLGCQKKNWCNITLKEFQEIMNFLTRPKNVLPFTIFVNFFIFLKQKYIKHLETTHKQLAYQVTQITFQVTQFAFQVTQLAHQVTQLAFKANLLSVT